MFANMMIGQRLFVLSAVLTAVLLVTGGTTLLGLNLAADATRNLNRMVSDGARLSYLREVVNDEFVRPANALHRGTVTWQVAHESAAAGRDRFEREWQGYVAALGADDREFVNDVLGAPVADLRVAMQQFLDITRSQTRSSLGLFMLNDLDVLVNPFLDSLQASIAQSEILAREAFERSTGTNLMFLIASSAAVLFGVLVALVLGVGVYRSITRPIARIASTVQAMSDGDYAARTGVTGDDELGVLGSAFDHLLDERIAALARAEAENEQLNESVIRLLEALDRLSERDLTVRLPVTEDVIGPVADAMNLMTGEIVRVLTEIWRVAESVEQASGSVKSQGDRVTALADRERRIVAHTMARLGEAVAAMNEIAKLAHSGNAAAARASETTDTALQTVTSTVEGMNEIRETISETEKRIKRLGERSQEITGIVEIINNLAERTHVLALNASMQAAAAGEAGRGFAVVAEEVQRLAESSRGSTSQISALVKNIQSETAETMATMNRSISQVVQGSELAEQAGRQMRETRETTAELVAAVDQIAERSLHQAQASGKLREYAGMIQKSTAQTNEQIKQQGVQTLQLVSYAKRLLGAVRVFRMSPGQDRAQDGAASVPSKAA